MKCENFNEIQSWPKVELLDCEYSVNASDFEVLLMIYDGSETHEGLDLQVSVTVDAEVEDFGIGDYEYGSGKCNDVAYGYMVNEISFDVEFPDNMRLLIDELLERMVEQVGQLEIDKDE